MGVIRVEKAGNYTVMSNAHLRDERLSLNARGLMSVMLSLPPDWNYTVAGLTAICKDGTAAIRAALKELEEAGYLIREQTHGEHGKFAETDYTLYEEPITASEASPLCENRTTVDEGISPLCDFPLTENPLTENRTLLSIDLNNNLNTNTPPISPSGGKRARKRTAKAEPDWQPEMFKRFWEMYPCGKDKQSAIQEWDRLKPDLELMRIMSAALKRQKASEEWQRGIGIPYACRWLSKRRWEDEKRITAPLPMAAGGWADDPERFDYDRS